MYNACHANHTHICWRKKKINKASFADFFSEKISKLAKKKCNFFLLLEKISEVSPSYFFLRKKSRRDEESLRGILLRSKKKDSPPRLYFFYSLFTYAPATKDYY